MTDTSIDPRQATVPHRRGTGAASPSTSLATAPGHLVVSTPTPATSTWWTRYWTAVRASTPQENCHEN